MKNTKLFVVFAAAGLAGSAFAQYASPELMMVVDDGGTTSTGATVQAQVERYDPYTGAYLGAFGAGYLNDPSGITIVGQNAYVSDQFSYNGADYSRIDEFNFSTGAYQGSIFNTGPYNLYGLAADGTNILASDLGDGSGNYGAVYTFNSAGQVAGVQNLPYDAEAENIATDGVNDYIGTISNGLMSYSLDGNGLSTGLNFQTGAGNSYYGVATTSKIPGAVFAAGINYSSYYGVLDEFSTSGQLLGEYTTGSTAYDSLAFGHNGMLYALGENNIISRFDGTTPLEFGPIGSFDLADTAVAVRIAVYAAPEPMPMVMLVGGAVGLALRRSRAKGR